jgi:hypothetical protein
MRRLAGLTLTLLMGGLAALFAQVGSGGISPGGTVNLPALPAVTETPVGAGAISGVIIDGATKAPLAGAAVQLSGTGIQARQMTDPKGRFAFPNLPPGTAYSVTSSAFGYLDAAYGREPGVTTGVPIFLRDAEWIQDVRVQMARPGAIGGTVLDERGDPVVGAFVRTLARVRLNGRDRVLAGPMTTTDDRGAYRLASLLPGRYYLEVPSVQASAPIAPQPGDGRGGGPAVANGAEPGVDGDRTSRLLLREYPSAVPDKARAVVYPPTFAPSSRALAGAALIDLKVGEERTAVDVTLLPVTAWRVSGTVQGPPEALSNLTLRLLPEGLESLGHGSETATALVDSDGRFSFLNVPEGVYTLDAPRTFTELTAAPGVSTGPAMFVGLGPGRSTFPIPPSVRQGWGSNSSSLDSGPPGVGITTINFRGTLPSYFGRTQVNVTGRDEDNIVVRLQPTGIMQGTVVTEVDPGKPTPAMSLTSGLRLEPASSDPALGRLQTQGPPSQGVDAFEIQGLMPGEYVLRGGLGGWTVKSIIWRGRDYTDRPFDAAQTPDLSGVVVTMTNGGPVLTGNVRTAQGTPAEAAFVMVFPADRSMWANYGLSPTRIRSTGAARNGTYRFTGLPAGDYFVLALEGARANWHEAEFMQAAEGLASRVSLAWGQTGTVDLAVAQVR